MKARRTEIELNYNGAAVEMSALPFLLNLTYTDPASGEADSLDLTFMDRKRQWSSAWLPITGDLMSAAIIARNRTEEGDDQSMSCGEFILDQFSFGGWPVTGTLAGVSVPADSSFRATARTKNWENVTIQEIGKEIAARAGVSLVWDAEGADFIISNIEQSEQNDCEFYMELCETYGFCMKVYAQQIVVYDREGYKENNPVGTITETEMTSWDWSRTLDNTYTGGEYTYTDPDSEEELKVTVGSGNRILKISGKADSKADAERKLNAAIKNANHGAVTLKLEIPGNAQFVSAQCVTVTGLGRMSGKYYIDKITHRVSGSGGYTMSMELALVETYSKEVVLDAIQRLNGVGVINTPAYWEAHWEDVQYLDQLLLNMATRIKKNLGGSSITTVEAALQVLTEEGVVNTPDYWQSKVGRLSYLNDLLIQAANALTEP